MGYYLSVSVILRLSTAGGSFDFMTYRIEKKMRPLIWVDCQILRYGRSRIEYVLKVNNSYKELSLFVIL
eukprot:1362125-Amorphochlora_amoeboformis.AAC.1